MGYVFRNFEASACVMGLNTNWHKTKIQNIGTGDASRTVHIDNEAETVSRFTYLGSDIDSDGYSYPEIHRRLGIAGSIMAQLDNVRRQQRLSLSTKLRIYTCLVQSVVLYGSETWTMRKVDSDRIQSFICKHCVVSLVSDGTTRYPTQKSMRERNYTRRYCWQTSFIIWSRLSPTGEHTCFAGTATVNRSPHQHSSRRWLEASAGSSAKKLAATSGRRHWPICWYCPDREPGSFDVKDATTLSWSSAAVSESEWMPRTQLRLSSLILRKTQIQLN